MTREISVRNVNWALSEGLWWLKSAGVPEESRNGPVLVAPGPVITEYERPVERVLFDSTRDANPVFHLMESIWMLAGYNDVSWLLPYNARFEDYAEANGRVHGAYGHRWRHHFRVNQIHGVIEELRAKPKSRQAVISMWDPEYDLLQARRDIPCNTTMYFDLRGGVLNMTVCCRSNDMLWGAYGANVVHMSVLQEVIAHAVGAPMGVYRQFSNNFHMYTELPMAQKLLTFPTGVRDPYATKSVLAYRLMQPGEDYIDFMGDCQGFVDSAEFVPRNEFLRSIARPLQTAYLRRKSGLEWDGVDLGKVPASCDWLLAFREWTERRSK